MEWTEDHDLCLSQEILSLEPFKAKKGSIATGNICDQIANNLNSLEIPRFRVSKRSVRERYTLLIEKLQEKLKEEEKASGIETSMSDVEKPLEEIMEKESDAENTVESNKKKADHAKPVEMQKTEMESIRSTQKRKRGDAVEDEENAQPKPKITMRSGGETVAYLREKNDMAQKWNYKSIIWVFRFSGILGKRQKNQNIVVKYFVGYFKFISCLCMTLPSRLESCYDLFIDQG